MKVIIVEDEVLAQQELNWLIKTHSQMDVVATFEDGLDVLKYLQQHDVDAIFSILIFRRWTAYCWRRTSVNSPASRLSYLSPPGKSTR
ncbi:response regulator receiver domain-containing protein [Cronobacter sp. 153480017-3]